MASEIKQAIKFICEEKGLSYEAVLEAIEQAMAAAYRKDYGDKMQNIEANFDPESGAIEVFDVKTIVEDISPEELEKIEKRQAEIQASREAAKAAGEPMPEIDPEEEPSFNPKTDIMFSDARVLKMDAKIGDILRTELPVPGEFGRMAAMTAKQVIMQKLREAEREIVFNEFKEFEGEVVIGTVQRKEGRVILVDLGRTTGVILPEDQIRTERYVSGSRMKVFVREVSLGARGPQILLSRTAPELVKILFDIEIPEVNEGIVEIKGIAREPGARSKIAVSTTDDSIDPIGACIGQRGMRIQTIINELGGEKIDIIEWSEDPKAFIESALAPAKVNKIELDEEEKSAHVEVVEDQLSLAIGRGGQNVRLAARLTGWKVNVKPDPDSVTESEDSDISEDSEITQESETPQVEESENEKTQDSPVSEIAEDSEVENSESDKANSEEEKAE